MIDAIVPRKEMRATLTSLVKTLGGHLFLSLGSVVKENMR
jgi:hypothetical protein